MPAAVVVGGMCGLSFRKLAVAVADYLFIYLFTSL
jgi:hypothetical protein